jgi:transcriptional regulator with XRE-family HTH domain
VAAGLTQYELAQRTGTDASTIGKYESGGRTPYVDRLAALAAALGVTPSELTQIGFDPGRLRQLRVAAGLSQRELAARAGTDRPTIAEYESGDRAPFYDRLAMLASALGVPPTELTQAGASTLAELRVAAGLTQLAAAEHAGLIRTRYSALERGEVATLDPTIATRLAQTFGVTPAQIATAHAQSRAVYLERRH